MVLPLEIITTGPARAAARLFRFDGQLHVAVIAKIRLLLVADGPMRACPPPGLDLAAIEGVPFRVATDVTFVGQAHARGREPSPQSVTRIAILRPLQVGGAMEGSETLLNKPLCAFEVERFGPLAARERADVLLQTDRARVEAPLPALWSSMDFSCFHAAPVDQRTPHLRGDEWIWLELLHPTSERFASQLPLLRAVGAIRLPHQDKPFVMRIDTLAIDGDSACCDVLARGSFAVGSEDDLKRIGVIAGFEIGRAPADVRVAPIPTPLSVPSRASNEEREEQAPVTVMSSALDARIVSDDEAPATRAPFQLARPGQARSASTGEIPGAPWASGPAPKATPASEDQDGTLMPELTDDEAQEMAALREAAQKLQGEYAKKRDEAKQEKPAVDPWRNLPEDRAPAPRRPAGVRPRVSGSSMEIKKSLYGKIKKR